jgi:hypothetical protein
MIQQAIKTDNKVIMENKSKFVLCHASSGKFHMSSFRACFVSFLKISLTLCYKRSKTCFARHVLLVIAQFPTSHYLNNSWLKDQDILKKLKNVKVAMF